MPEIDSELWDDLCHLLDNRFSRKIHTSEDSIRYCFFYTLACSRKICHPNDVILEYPHPNISGAQIDTCVRLGKDGPDYAIEFKFHRKSNTISPKPMKAGMLFKDLFRQAKFKKTYEKTTCYVVYVTDMEMWRYFGKPSNGCKTWYNLRSREHLLLNEEYFSKVSDTFRKKIETIVPCIIQRAAKYQMDSGYMLIVDEISSLTYHGNSDYHAPNNEPTPQKINKSQDDNSTQDKYAANNSKNNVTAPVAVWIATATLHKQYPTKNSFSKKEIFNKVREQNLFDKDDSTISTHISSHCVANIKAQPGDHKKIYRVSRGRYRLYRLDDNYDITRKSGTAEPSIYELPDKYHDLLDWYKAKH